MLFEDYAAEVAGKVYEMVSDMEKAVKAAIEIVPVLASSRSEEEKKKIICKGKALATLGSIFEKWDTYNNMSGLPDLLLAYLIGKNPGCYYDTIQIYEKNEEACSDWVGVELFKPVGVDLVEYQMMQRASSILLMYSGNKDMVNSFLRNYKDIYRSVDDDTEAWKRRMITSVAYSREDIACLLYYAYSNRDMVTNNTNCCAIEGVPVTDLLEELEMNQLRLKIYIYSRLVTAGRVELAAWMQSGHYMQNKMNASLAYADRVMLETETWYDVFGESAVNEKEIHSAAPFYQDTFTVKELLRRLTVISDKYNKLIYRSASYWDAERKEHYPISSIETFENYKKVQDPFRR